MMKLYNAVNSAIKRGFNALFFACRDLTDADGGQQKLTRRTAYRVRRFFHFCLCRFCRAYNRQVKLIERQTDTCSRDFPEDTSAGLSPDARDKIRERLRGLKDDQ